MTESTQPSMPTADPELVDHLGRLLAESEGEPAPFLILSDEEIVAIDQGIDPEFSICPWIDAQDDLETGAFARFGERSLLLRGLLTPDVDLGGEGSEPEVRVEVSEELRLGTEARRRGIGFVRMTSTFDGDRTGCIAVLQPRHGVYEEEVGAEGFHYLTGCSYESAVERLGRWAVPITLPEDVAGALTIPEDEWAAWAVNELGVEARQVELDLYLPSSASTMDVRHWVVAHSDDQAVLTRPSEEDGMVQVLATSAPALAAELADQLVRAVGLVQS